PIYQRIVEVEARLVHRSTPPRQHSRPRDGEAIGIMMQPCHQVEVFLPAVIVVACDVTGASVCDRAGCMAEAIPYGLALTVLACGALDLIGSGGSTPGKIPRESRLGDQYMPLLPTCGIRRFRRLCGIRALR